MAAQWTRCLVLSPSSFSRDVWSNHHINTGIGELGTSRFLQPPAIQSRFAATRSFLPQVDFRAHAQASYQRQNNGRMVSEGHGDQSTDRRPRDEVPSSVIPAKRLPDGLSKINGKLSKYGGEEDELLKKRSPKHGKASGENIENKIPCICFMTGNPEYRKCTKRHKYLSHLARHLHSHDVYICQMCFSKFDGEGKEENLRKKQTHHCVKFCNDGNCKRHCAERDKALFTDNTCKHLVKWQDRWIELFQTQFPGVVLPRLGTMDSSTPDIRSRQNSASTQIGISDSQYQAIEPTGRTRIFTRQNGDGSQPTDEDQKNSTHADSGRTHLSNERRGVQPDSAQNSMPTNSASKKVPTADLQILADRVHSLESALDRSLGREKGLLLELTELKRGISKI
ncbi:uncharacterized protein MYCFIDRAFT_84302 [Pseudocercospora fijiensis CIRAD86]|uniref:Uncharacterized protein n=1 Tax=Pseudocercospora fijiensis (strain CIRAD86) TaxID=383855 RepID=M2ZZR4_PSEFD|nr:uncharacterized protein MYCFIDRAFT_84302 [Pseudocercospora fijiensis CIRAD86]EME77651.1 hypothetical protein MYCFIDRAFT_84302 [Pseudocercospora fijiensis CIRAD86]